MAFCTTCHPVVALAHLRMQTNDAAHVASMRLGQHGAVLPPDTRRLVEHALEAIAALDSDPVFVPDAVRRLRDRLSELASDRVTVEGGVERVSDHAALCADLVFDLDQLAELIDRHAGFCLALDQATAIWNRTLAVHTQGARPPRRRDGTLH